ncbi:hypothetical protein [Enterococcus rotai]|uniref:hypothetical protein n=1 Tax=Enterococcus rotai TaxID=118060 RepID=UPI0032B56E8B
MFKQNVPISNKSIEGNSKARELAEVIEKCKDQASKIVALKHELGLVVNYISSVNLVNALDENEAAFSLYGLLIHEQGLENIARTIDAKLEDLETIACTLFDIDDDEITESLQMEQG